MCAVDACIHYIALHTYVHTHIRGTALCCLFTHLSTLLQRLYNGSSYYCPSPSVSSCRGMSRLHYTVHSPTRWSQHHRRTLNNAHGRPLQPLHTQAGDTLPLQQQSQSSYCKPCPTLLCSRLPHDLQTHWSHWLDEHHLRLHRREETHHLYVDSSVLSQTERQNSMPVCSPCPYS